MGRDNAEESGGPKRRKLDELFADEPFLSPTMKARRLHEKLYEQADAPVGSQDRLPTAAFVRSITERSVDFGRAEAHTAARVVPEELVSIQLVDAAIFLRSNGAQIPRGVSAASQSKLLGFRSSTLQAWLQAISDR